MILVGVLERGDGNMGEITEECGCSVSIPVSGSYAGGPEDGIIYCPMHKAAEAILEALECYELPSGHFTGCTMYEGNCQPHCEKGRKALAQARGQEVVIHG